MPIVARFGPFVLTGYTAVLLTATLLGLGVTAVSAARRALPDWLDACLASLVGALLGGRMGFVIGQWAYFQVRPADIGHFAQGGLSAWGAYAGGVVFLAGWAWGWKRPFGDYANLLLPTVALVHLAGWAGCWLQACAYGRETTWPTMPWQQWWIADLPDAYGLLAWRYQTQLVGLMTGMAVLLFLLWGTRYWSALTRLLLGLTLLHLNLALVTLWRGDPVPMLPIAWPTPRLDFWLSMSVVVLCLILLQYQLWRNGRSPSIV